MSEERLNGELAAIEAVLGSLTPAPSGIERYQLMFLAGRASAITRRTPTLLWRIAAGVSLVIAATFGILWAGGNNAKPVERTAEVAVAPLPMAVDLSADTPPPSPWENRQLYRLVVEKGIDALPESPGHFAPGVPSVPREETDRSLLKQLLDNPRG